MNYWLTDQEGKQLAKLIVSQESLQVLSDEQLLRDATSWLARRRHTQWWRGCGSMSNFLYEFSVSAENATLPIQVRFI